MNGKRKRSKSWHLSFVTAVAVIAALYFGREILIPFAIAVLLSFLLAPLVKRAERIGLNRIGSVVLVTVLSFCVILGVGWLIVTQARAVTKDLPVYQENIVEKVRSVRGSIHGILGSASDAMQDIRQEIGRSEARGGSAAPPGDPNVAATSGGPDARADAGPQPDENADAVKVKVVSTGDAELGVLTAALSSLVRPLLTAGLAFIFVIFMLIWREDLRDRVIRVFGSGRVSFSTQALNEMGAAVSRYLLLLFLVNAANGALIALGLWLLGLPSALLWGLLMAVLRFLPLVGTLTAASLPILLSLAISDSWSYPLLVVVLFLTVDGVSSNFVEPILYGSRVGASPMAVLVSATFWTWIWGPIGLLLAMPLTVALVVLGRYVRPLSFLTILLGDQPALPRELRFYQRLLSNEVKEAKAIVQTSLEQGQSLEQVFEEVVAPGVVMAKEDYASGLLDEAHADFLNDSVESILTNQMKEEEGPAKAARPLRTEFKHLRIDCVPARGPFDELFCKMMCRLLDEEGMPCRVISQRVLAGELVESLDNEQVDLVCILAIGQDGEIGARYLVKRLLKRHPDLPIVIGAWGAQDGGALAGGPWRDGQIQTATSFKEALGAVTRLSAKALAASPDHRNSEALSTT